MKFLLLHSTVSKLNNEINITLSQLIGKGSLILELSKYIFIFWSHLLLFINYAKVESFIFEFYNHNFTFQPYLLMLMINSTNELFPSTKNLIKLFSIYYITVFYYYPSYHIAYSNILLLVLVQILRICEALLVLPPLLVDWSPAHKLIRPESSSKHYG